MAAQIAHALLAEEAAGGHVRQRSVDQVGEHGIDDRVPSVGDVGVDSRFRAVGEERVVAPHREQLVVRAWSRTRRTTSRAVTGHRVLANAVNETSATSASEINCPVSGSTTAPG